MTQTKNTRLPDRWWRAEDSLVADALIAHAKGVETSQSGRTTNYKKALKLYQGRNVLPGQSLAYLQTPDGEILNLNVVASIIRSLRAKVVKSRPAPMVLTDGGSQSQQDQAKGLQAFLEGAIYETDTYGTMERSFDITAICGDAWAKTYADYEDECTRVETRYPWEVFVSDLEGYRGAPRSIYERAYLDREVLLACNEEHQDAILTAPTTAGDPDFALGGESDLIEVWEGWRLPSTRKSLDGRHVIAIQGAALLSEAWTRDRFPFAHFAIESEPVGCHGVGICDELYGMQMEVNNVLAKVTEGHRLGGNIMIFVPVGAKINPAKLSNEGHILVPFEGPIPPQAVTIPAVAQEVYNYLWTLVDRMYAIYGVSQLSAQSIKPAGLNSGRALRTYADVESERFSYISRAYERFMLDISHGILDAAQDLSEKVPGYAVRFQKAETIKRIKWKDVDMDRDSYVMRVHPVSFLPQTPAGKLAAVQDLIDLKVIDPREARIMLDMPDLKSRPDPYEASYQLARYQVDRMLQDGVPQTPEAYQDLNTALSVALDAYNRARTYDDMAEQPERLDLLRDYIEAVQGLLAPPPPPAPEAVSPDAAALPPDAAPMIPPDQTVPAPPPVM